MCVFYVRVVDKDGCDTDEHIRAGEVVFVKPDGWSFGTAELSSTEHKVVRLAGVPETMFASMETSLTPIAGRVLAKRQLRFSDDALVVLRAQPSPVDLSLDWAFALFDSIENKVIGATVL